ncbi:MAG: DUF2628 domain-containing protein [Parvibaculum sp.]|nr:DUF2628 domain-containing protein [Parvibaculum sp.]
MSLGKEIKMSDEEKFNAFITDPNTKLFVSKNFETYRSKWTSMFNRSQSMQKLATTRSWNWSAFLLTSSWLFYRKMYGAAIGVSVAMLAGAIVELVWDISTTGGAIGLSVVLGMLGNAFYFQHVNKTLEKYRNAGSPEALSDAIHSLGGTSWPIAILGTLGTVVVFFVVFMVLDQSGLIPEL